MVSASDVVSRFRYKLQYAVSSGLLPKTCVQMQRRLCYHLRLHAAAMAGNDRCCSQASLPQLLWANAVLRRKMAKTMRMHHGSSSAPTSGYHQWHCLPGFTCTNCERRRLNINWG